VKAPTEDATQFSNQTGAGLKNIYDQIAAYTVGEPFAVNESEFGQFLGNINFLPYSDCQ
jgi:hypothetical protein